jgi:hypothetical protein
MSTWRPIFDRVFARRGGGGAEPLLVDEETSDSENSADADRDADADANLLRRCGVAELLSSV